MTTLDLFEYARNLMESRGINSFYGPKKTPKDAVDAGVRSLGSTKATQMRSKAFSKGEVLEQLNSPTYCRPVDAYVPFWWAVKNYPEEMFADWDKRITMAAGLQKQQYVFQTTAQVYLKNGVSVDQKDLLDAEHYMDLQK